MRVLIVHNEYQQAAGEAAVVAAESALLAEHGNTVETVLFDNNTLRSPAARFSAAINIGYSVASRNKVDKIVGHFKPDVVHVHNTFPLATPSIFDACRARGVPVVKTLHNFRLFCAAHTLYRDGGVCEKCLHASAYHAVVHACYRHSRVATLPVAYLIARHRRAGTWQRKVDRFIALTDFARDKFVSAGLPPEKTIVKPNFAHRGVPANGHGSYALYVGRLSEEKGISTLLKAWQQLRPAPPLIIAGDGQLRPAVDAAAAANPAIQALGRVAPAQVRELISGAAFLVMPSQWYEGFPMVIVESFGSGLPVIASRLGSMASIVADGRNGLLFVPGKPDELAQAVRQLFDDPALRKKLREGASACFEQLYTPERNYRQLIDIYEDVIAQR